MSSTAAKRLLASSCLGLLTGASFGLEAAWLPAGWLLSQMCTYGQLLLLTQPEVHPRAAARALSLFAAAATLGALSSAAFGLPADVRLLALLPLAALVAASAATAWLVGYVSFATPASLWVRTAILLPSLWVCQEWLLSLPDVAIPWFRIGHVQAAGGPLAGALPYGGVLLASWLTLCVSGLAAAAWRGRDWRTRSTLASLAAGTMCATVAAGTIDWTQPHGTLKAALIQAGTASQVNASHASVTHMLDHIAQAVRQSDAPLIVTSQLAIDRTLSALPPAYLSHLHALLASKGADALIGIYLTQPHEARPFNGVVSVGRSGQQTYRKHRLFPFGESLPLNDGGRAWLQSMLQAPVLELAAGPADTSPLVAGSHRVAMALCFELAFGDPWRRQAATADALVNVSSDTAIDSLHYHLQTKQLAQARALELQKPLLRTSDVRGSFVVDARGQVGSELPHGAASVLHVAVEARTGLTPYARWGDDPVLCLALVCVCVSLLRACRDRHSASAPAAGRPVPQPASVASSSGQVLPAAVVLLLVASAMFYLMVNAGQTVTEKLRVTNAADAAAHSAGVVEARALNYSAYLNRAMVANEIAIAQMVSFASWVDYFATASDNFGANAVELNFFLLPNPQVAILDAAFGGSSFAAAHLGGTTVQAYANHIVAATGPAIAAHDIAVRALSLSQQAVHLNLVAGLRQRQVANDVVEAMDPQLSAEVVLPSHGFDAFTRAYARAGSAGDERGRFADVTTRSRDPFTRERNWTVSSFDIPLLRDDPALKKRGGTDLVGFDEWRAVDTLELHGRRWGCGKWGLSWCGDVQTPIGWGAVEIDAGAGDVGRGHHGNAYNENPRTAARAEGAMTTPPFSTFSGLPDTRDLGDLDPRHETSTGITIRVTKSHASTLTSGNAAQPSPSGRLALFDGRPAGGHIAALSRAQVFFDRIAARNDSKVELASLYNPYWRVRLVAPTAADKAYAASRQEGLALP